METTSDLKIKSGDYSHGCGVYSPDWESHKKNQTAFTIWVLYLNLAMSYFHMGNPTLSSALIGFTSEFEMGSGGSQSLLSPENWSQPKAV